MTTPIQWNYTITAPGSPANVVLPLAATAGNTIVLVVGYGDFETAQALPTPTFVTDPGTYTVIFAPVSNTINCGIAAYYLPNCGAHTYSTNVQGFSAPSDNNFFGSVALYEVSGLTTSPLDKSNNAFTINGGSTQSGGQPTGTTGTLTQASEWVLAFCTFDDNPGQNPEGVSVPTGFTVDPNQPANFQNLSNNILNFFFKMPVVHAYKTTPVHNLNSYHFICF